LLKLGIIANILNVVDLEQKAFRLTTRQINRIARWLILGFYPYQKIKQKIN